MKIAVFGSTGPCGQLIIKYALEKGYEVVAFARNPSKIVIENKNLRIIKGELNDIASIEEGIKNVDAVVSILGPKGNVKNTDLSDGYGNIIAAMKKLNVKRIVAMGTASVTDPDDKYVFKFRLLVSIVKSVIPGAYKEIVRIGQLVRNSSLDWTLVRIAILTNGKASGKIKAGNYGKASLGLTISRADLATFFVNQVEDRTYIQKAPAISN
jgi:putative NADH-flavin reductase